MSDQWLCDGCLEHARLAGEAPHPCERCARIEAEGKTAEALHLVFEAGKTAGQGYAAIALLKKLEWAGNRHPIAYDPKNQDVPRCPCCERPKPTGDYNSHRPDCELARLIR